MQTFQISTFNQSRLLTLCILGSFTFVGTIFLVAILDDVVANTIIGIVIGSAFLGISYFYTYTKLHIHVKDEALHFEWEKKPIFSQKPVPPMPFQEIQQLVIDKNTENDMLYLQKIKTAKHEIRIGNTNLLEKDSQKFIPFLLEKLKGNSQEVEILDSWQVWSSRGWLKLVFQFFTGALILLTFLLIGVTIKRGFQPEFLAYGVAVLIEVFLYRKVIKSQDTSD